ncbi:IclR family transcriptional regulator domain-containing protein, partial [Streptomyces rectiviolaceus]
WAAWRARVAADPQGDAFPALPPGPATPPPEPPDLADRVERSRVTGWALDDQLIEPGLIATAVPVRDAAGRARYALSAVSHTSRHTARGLAELVLPRLREEAELLEELPTAQAAYGEAELMADQGPDTADAKAELGPDFLQSLARGLTVLRALGPARGDGLPLTAVAAATGLPRATARRCLHTLELQGYAAHDGRLYRPLPRVLELGYARLSRLGFADIAEPHLRRLTGRVHQSASVTVLDGTDILYVARAATVRVMSVYITLGTRFPAYPTAMGRVLLAGLPKRDRARLLKAAPPKPLTRRTVTDPADLNRVIDRAAAEGYATADEELEEGLRSVAVPLKDAEGRVVAALNVAQHAGTAPLGETIDALLPVLRETAAAIETDLHTAARFNSVRMP